MPPLGFRFLAYIQAESRFQGDDYSCVYMAISLLSLSLDSKEFMTTWRKHIIKLEFKMFLNNTFVSFVLFSFCLTIREWSITLSGRKLVNFFYCIFFFCTGDALPCRIGQTHPWKTYRLDIPSSFHSQYASPGDHSRLVTTWKKSSLQITLTQTLRISED